MKKCGIVSKILLLGSFIFCSYSMALQANVAHNRQFAHVYEWQMTAQSHGPYFLIPKSRVLLEKPTGSQLVKKFPAFYGARRFITAFTSARRLSLSWARSIQSMPSHPTSWRSSLILSSHLRLGLPSGLFLSRFPTKTMYTPLPHATCPAYPFLLDLITRIIFFEEYRLSGPVAQSV